jgi:hypothetical protein
MALTPHYFLEIYSTAKLRGIYNLSLSRIKFSVNEKRMLVWQTYRFHEIV